MVRIHTFPPLDQRYVLTFLKKYDIINIQKRKIIKLKLLKGATKTKISKKPLKQAFEERKAVVNGV